MELNFKTYKEKVYGCFTGKSVGGTLGMPFEGQLDVDPVTYYDPVPTEMVPTTTWICRWSILKRFFAQGFRFHVIISAKSGCTIWKIMLLMNIVSA